MATNDKNRTVKSIARKVLNVAGIATLLLYYPIMMSFIAADKETIECSKIVAKVKSDDDNILITDKGLEQIIWQNFPDIKGTRITEMHLYDMERTVEQSPVVKRCDMYTTPGGILHVEISQRKPIMRVFTSNSSYYMDSESFRIPVQNNMLAHTIVVNGNVNALLDGKDIIELCDYINKDKFWKSLFEQVFITDKQEYILIPRMGDHIVEFGGNDRMEEKFELLHTLYSYGWKPNEWNAYKKVNLKYKGQIVCTKR